MAPAPAVKAEVKRRRPVPLALMVELPVPAERLTTRSVVSPAPV